jgi:hypothetical protein
MTQKEKIQIYESFFHQINLFYAVSMNSEKVQEALNLISDWSYTHRANVYDGNEKEREKRIEELVIKMRDFK